MKLTKKPRREKPAFAGLGNKAYIPQVIWDIPFACMSISSGRFWVAIFFLLHDLRSLFPATTAPQVWLKMVQTERVCGPKRAEWLPSLRDECVWMR